MRCSRAEGRLREPEAVNAVIKFPDEALQLLFLSPILTSFRAPDQPLQGFWGTCLLQYFPSGQPSIIHLIKPLVEAMLNELLLCTDVRTDGATDGGPCRHRAEHQGRS